MLNSKDKFQLYKGDCLEIMKNIESNSVNLVLIDPPYNINKDKKWDKWKTVDAYVEFMGQVFLECQRVLKDNGSFYFFHNDFLQIVELQNWINKNTKFKFKQLLVWNKRFKDARNKGFLDGFCEVENLRNYQQMAEYCLFYTFQDGSGLESINFNTSNYLSIKKYLSSLLEQKNMKYDDKQLVDLFMRNGVSKNKESAKVTLKHILDINYKQYQFITERHYNILNEILEFDRTYEDLRCEYESLRQEYESLRYTFNNQKQHHSVMNFEVAKKQGHITPKPVDLLEYIIRTSSNEGDVVLDCFAGSGSTGVACLNTNRKFIGIEKDDKYFDIAYNRINGCIHE